jgi:hypothetical protein
VVAYSANSLRRKREFVSGYKVTNTMARAVFRLWKGGNINIHLEKQSNALYI